MTAATRDWSMDEVIFASRLHGQGHPPEAIAMATGRSAMSVRNKLQRIGLWKSRPIKDNYELDLRGKLRRR